MSYSPLVSVLINNYNYGQFIEDAIESVLSQSYKNIELIVVDDGSTDDSKAKIMRFANRVTAIFQHNSGQASAFNAGFAASHGDIIAFLDADDYFLPEKIEKIVSLCLHTYFLRHSLTPYSYYLSVLPRGHVTAVLNCVGGIFQSFFPPPLASVSVGKLSPEYCLCQRGGILPYQTNTWDVWRWLWRQGTTAMMF